MADTNQDRDDRSVSSVSEPQRDGLLQRLVALVRASDEIAEALSEPSDLQRSVQLVSHQARTVAQADLGAMILTAGPNTTRVAAVSGSQRIAGVVLAAQGSIDCVGLVGGDQNCHRFEGREAVRVLVASIPGLGHVHPMVPIARAFRVRRPRCDVGGRAWDGRDHRGLGDAGAGCRTRPG